MNGWPVRVVRRTEDGYRYDGLYRVDDFWSERGRSGFLVWRYRLFAEDVSETVVAEESKPYGPAARVSWKTQRIVRDIVQAMRIKRLYDYRCQVCGVRLEGSVGPYAEAAHIRPLGTPHNGPDIESNLLCLCPNHHVLFDYGGFAIADDLTLIGIHGSLIVQRRHEIGVEFLRYHRDHYAMQRAD